MMYAAVGSYSADASAAGQTEKINNPNASGSMLLPMATSDAEGQSRAIAYIQLGYAVVQKRAQKSRIWP